MALNKKDYLRDAIQHVDVTKLNVLPVVDAMQHMAYSARDVTVGKVLSDFARSHGVELRLSRPMSESVSGTFKAPTASEFLDREPGSELSEHAVPFYNAGLYAFRPSIFEFTAKLKPSPRGEYELTDAIRNLAQSGRKVQALELTGEWADVRDPEILARLNSQL